MQRLNLENEKQRLVDIYEHSPAKVMEALERQFAILHNRSQILLGLCGVIITTTGFSGRLIAGTNVLAQTLIIAGVSLTLLAAAVVVWGVLHLRWLSQQLGDNLDVWVITCLAYRDRKTRAYRAAITIFLVGAALYVGAIAVMLINPDAHAVTPVR